MNSITIGRIVGSTPVLVFWFAGGLEFKHYRDKIKGCDCHHQVELLYSFLMVYNTSIFDKGIAEESTHLHFCSPFINDTSQIGVEIGYCRPAYAWVENLTQVYICRAAQSCDSTATCLALSIYV